MVSSEVLDSAERWISPNVQTWSASTREYLEEWLAPSLSLVADAEWGAQIRDLVQLPIDDPLEWANRWINATSLRPEPAGLNKITEVLPHFDKFSPLGLRVCSPT